MRIVSLIFIVLIAGSPALSSASSDAYKVEVSGEGAAVIFLPGLASSGDVWNETLQALGTGYESHVFTLAGFAGVAPVDGPFFETRLAALRRYIADNDLRDVTVVGHSLGGFMAMKLALEEPERIGKVVIVDSVPFLALLFIGVQTVDQAREPAERMRSGAVQMTDAAFEAQQKAFVKTQAGGAEAQSDILSWSLSSDRQTIADASYALFTTDLRSELPKLEIPVLVLYPWLAGSPFPQQQIDFAYRAQYPSKPNYTLKRIDDSRHFIMFDQPERMMEEVTAFIGE